VSSQSAPLAYSQQAPGGAGVTSLPHGAESGVQMKASDPGIEWIDPRRPHALMFRPSASKRSITYFLTSPNATPDDAPFATSYKSS